MLIKMIERLLIACLALFAGFAVRASGTPARCEHAPLVEQAAGVAQALASDAQPSCEPPDIGRARAIRISESASPTGIPHNYLLKRTGEQSFEVAFHLRFGGIDGTRREALETVVRDCLRDLNALWKEPNGHRSLAFRLAEASEGAPPIDIRVGPTSDRRNYSTEWNERIACPSIMHELLHHAGLVDEYSEREIRLGTTHDHDVRRANRERPVRRATRAPGPAYDCRKTWNDLSIMNSPQLAFMAISAPQLLTVDWCECGRANPQAACARTAQERRTRPPEANCPEGFRVRPEFSETFPQFPDMGIAPPKPPGLSTKEVEALVQVHSVSTMSEIQSSLFRERFFNAIAFPGCLARNADYYAAAENAYRTSVARGGQGCRAAN